MRNQINAVVSRDSGAFEVDGNLATLSGYACVAGGITLAGAIGMAVAPLPTIGLATAGGGLIVAGNFNDIKEYFSKTDESTRVNEDPLAVAKELVELQSLADPAVQAAV